MTIARRVSTLLASLPLRRMALAILMLCGIAGPLRAAQEEARVLMLYGLDPYISAFLAMDKAMRESLSTKTDRPVSFYPEVLDSQRFAINSLEPAIADLLAKKYSALRIDVVVAVSRTALDFFERYGERIWPGAKVVYVGFLGYESRPLTLPAGAFAVLSYLDAAGTIGIARRLQPEARRMIVVSGVAEIDRTGEQQAREALAKMHEQAPVEFLSGLPQAELLARLAAVPPDSSVIFLTQFRDRDGRPYDSLELLRAAAAASRAPVYGTAEPYIGAGAVAGSVASYESRGRLVGKQVRRALADEPPDPGGAVLAAPNRCVADAHTLQRLSMDAGRLQGDCEIRFADVPAWRHYWWQITLALAVIAAQMALIVALLSQRRGRRIAEQAVEQQRFQLAHALRLQIAVQLTGSIAHEINQPLGAILSNADAADLILASGADRREELRQILGDVRRDGLRASKVIDRLRKLLAKHKVERNSVNVNELLREVEALLVTEAKRRRVALEILPAAPDLAVFGDRVQFQQVLINLVLNAFDAAAGMPDSRRTVTLSAEGVPGGAVIHVRDRGRGIAPEELPRLFEPFFTTKDNGMGLGLAISRSLVESHGGRLWAGNNENGGAVFHVQLLSSSAAGAMPI